MTRRLCIALVLLSAPVLALDLIQKTGTNAPTSLLPGQLGYDTAASNLWIGGTASNPVLVAGQSATIPLVATNDSRDLSFSNVFIRGSLTLDNTTWDDLRIPMSTARAGASVPNYSAFTNGVYVWHFVDGQTDTLYFETQLPHNYANGSDLRPHVHWSAKTASTNSVVWEFEYAIANIYSNYPASSTMTVTAACDNVAMKHHLTSFGTITGTGIRPSAVLIGRISRLGTDGADTYTGDACPLSLDIHYQQNKVMGSDNEIPD